MSIGAEIGTAIGSAAMSSVLPIVGMVRDKKWRDEDIARADSLTRAQWVRDDSAIQRRVSDLKKAGINPLLAAGSAANSSQPLYSSRAPQSVSGNVDAVMARENIATSRMQRQLLQAEIDGKYGMLAIAQQDADTRSSAEKIQEAQLFINRLADERNALLAQKSLSKSDSEIALLDKRIEQLAQDMDIAKSIFEHNMIYADRAAAPYGQQPTSSGALLSAGIQRGRVSIGEKIKEARAREEFSNSPQVARIIAAMEDYKRVRRGFSTHDFKVTRSKTEFKRPNSGRQYGGYYY